MITTDKILLNGWHVVAKQEDCLPGKILSARLLGEDLLLWRPEDPQAPLQVWLDHCPHRGARLSLGEVCNSTLVCPYHGWQYDTAGKCVRIPAHPTLEPPAGARVKTYQCQERYGWVWVCLGSPNGDVPWFPEWDDPNCAKFWCGPFDCNASAFRLMDISVDVAHVPFVHRQSIGASNPQIQDYELEVNSDGITVPERIQQMDSEGKVVSEQATSLTKVSSPLSISVSIETTQEPFKGRHAYMAVITPVEEEKCRQWTCVATTIDSNSAQQWVRMHEQTILEDIRITNSQQPARLPLLPPTGTGWPADLHVPSDRASVAYRKWLKQLGVNFGVC